MSRSATELGRNKLLGDRNDLADSFFIKYASCPWQVRPTKNRSVEREQNYRYVGIEFSNLLSRLNSRHYGHRKIQDDQIGLVFNGEANGFRAVLCLRANLHINVLMEGTAKKLPHEGRVIGY